MAASPDASVESGPAFKFGNKGKSRRRDEAVSEASAEEADKGGAPRGRRRVGGRSRPISAEALESKIIKQSKALPASKLKIKVPESITVRELALRSNIQSIVIINKLMEIGSMDDAARARGGGAGAAKDSSGLAAAESAAGVRFDRQINDYTLTQLKLEARTGRSRLANTEVSTAAESITVSADVAELVLIDLGFEAEREVAKAHDERRTDAERALLEEWPGLEPRSPIVTVMGHVDHGKTSLLDALRKTKVAQGEAGGITQAVGAFTVMLGDSRVVFLDTPGHEAFASMRRCGSMLTDLIVLVISSADGVQPQTVECAELALAAGVPVIVALSKIDTPGVVVDEARLRVGGQLQLAGLFTEDFGGHVQVVPIAAIKGVGLEDLTDAISLQADEMNLRAQRDARGEAVVLESRLDRAVGALTDVVVRWGTLRTGDFIVCGEQQGRVRQMLDTVTGEPVDEAGPATPVRVVGLALTATPATDLLAVPNAKRAREIADLRTKRRVETERDVQLRELRLKELAKGPALDPKQQAELALLERKRPLSSKQKTMARIDQERAARISEREGRSTAAVKVPVIIKADTDGSLEALRYSVDAVSAELKQLAEQSGLREGSEFQVVRRGVGPVTSSDVDLAKAFGAHIFAFNVRVPPPVTQAAAKLAVPLVTQSVIYHLLDDMRKLVEERAPRPNDIEVLGQLKVLKVFSMQPRKRGESTWVVAGCSVLSGKLARSNRIRVMRDNKVLFSGGLDSLKNFKADAQEVTKGQECGVSLSAFQDFKEGDVIEAYTEQQQQA